VNKAVIPLFIDYLKAGKNVPVTLPYMTRFLLSLEDAADLVELAMKKGEQGDIFIKKSPAATVEDLASALIQLFGSQNRIEVVGIREGEKLHELLAHHIELGRADDLGTHFRIRSPHGFNYQNYFAQSTGKREDIPDYSSGTATRLSVAQVKKFLLSLPLVQEELSSSSKR
jgi:UDP-glucose 4-epimerase